MNVENEKKRELKMNSFSSLLLILGYLSTLNSEKLNKEGKESLPSTETKNSNSVAQIVVRDTDSSLETLNYLAKNISHSKGIYRKTYKESPDDALEVRRSILKKSTVISDSAAMKDILERIQSEENKLQLLQNLEFLIHQFDVAVNFASTGGLEMITPLLFSSNEEIASLVARILGAAMQSNPTVQELALKHDIGRKLFNLLSHKSPKVLPRILFAVASLLRNSPEAQEEFLVMDDGISKLADILRNHQIATSTKLKIINLFNDLAIEQQTAESYSSSWSSEKIQEYKRLFEYKIQSCDICKVIPSFLDLEDIDTHEKVVAAMMSLYSVCYKDFKNVATNNRLSELLRIYDPESDEDSTLYPKIDKDIKWVLYSELTALYKKNNEIFFDKSTSSSKTDL